MNICRDSFDLDSLFLYNKGLYVGCEHVLDNPAENESIACLGLGYNTKGDRLAPI